MSKQVIIGNHAVGEHLPVYIVAEIGINHNGDIAVAKKLIDIAVLAGCDAVKFQKRNPDISVPPEQRDKMRETPWGYISYMDYRRKLEFGFEEYKEIDAYCRTRSITWFASCWDVDSVDFIDHFDVPCLKIPSPCITDEELLTYIHSKKRPLMMSTGMSTVQEIERAIAIVGHDNLIILHTTSTYPCPNEELNLRMIQTLKDRYNVPVGYSGHEVGLATTAAAVALGACVIERHVTVDHSLWGTDQAASVATIGLIRLVKYIREVEKAMGDGVKRVYASESLALERLRTVKECEYRE